MGSPNGTPHGSAVVPPTLPGLALRAAPVAVAVAVYGLSFGVLAVAAGLSPLAAILSSLFICAGGSQFAFVGVLAAGGNPLAGAAGGLLLNLRFVAFGLAIGRDLPRGTPLPQRLVDAQLIVDETVALTLGGPTDHRARRFRAAGALLVLTWVLTTMLGAYGGSLIGDLETWGMDVAFPAGFVALAAPWLRSRRGRVAALAGAGLALVLTPNLPPGIPVVLAALGAVVATRVPERDTDTADAAESDAR